MKLNAIVMEDMIRALEKQPNNGRGRVNRAGLMNEYINAPSVGRKNQTQNRYIKAKAEKEENDKVEAQKKAEQKRIHDDRIKKKLEVYQKERQIKQQ